MKESTTAPYWPRGLLAGALLAVCLIVPAFVVMMADSGAGATRLASDAPSRMPMFPRPLQLRANSAFFAGRLEVQAVLAQRLAPPPRDAQWPTAGPGAPRDLNRDSQLRLRLENRSDQNLEIEIVRVDSGLSDFVARPGRLMLAPNQVATVDSPVPSRKITANSIPVAVALRLSGSLETQQLVLNDRTLAQAGN